MKKNLRVQALRHLLAGVIKCMTYYSRIIYLAGPDVFEANPIAVGEEKKRICKSYGYTGLYPLDNEIPPQESKKEMARLIFEGNVNYIGMCNMVIANLNNFRGACDSGTMWEIGYALSIGKIVIVYAEDVSVIPESVKKLVVCIQASSFEECLKQVEEMDFCDYKKIWLPLKEDEFYNLDPESDDIQDIDAEASFKVGFLYGMGVVAYVTISDSRSQIEKYGTECCGYSVEDFDLPYNLMIWFSSINFDAVNDGNTHIDAQTKN